MQVTNVWKTVEENKNNPRTKAFMSIAREEDLMLALNYYDPGYKNKFHHHWGTSQSFLVLKGVLTLRTRKTADAAAEERTLEAGDCAVMVVGEYYQLANEGSEPLVLYQAKRPTNKIQILGHEPVDETTYFADAV
jgi:mannose-6-phosphate isomerase-like protein (cupin superfamily)